MNLTIQILLQVGLALLWLGIGYNWGEMKAKREFNRSMKNMFDNLLGDLEKMSELEVTKITKKKGNK